MNSLPYLRDSLFGAWLVMLGRPEGLAKLDTSIEGFWRSFAAVILLAPFALLSLIGPQPAGSDAADTVAPLTGGVLAVSGVALLVDWFTFPLIFALLARTFGLGSRYVPYIVARNWASPIISAMVSIVHVLRLFGVLPLEATPFALLIGLAVALRFSYVVARTALGVSMAMAVPIVVLDFLLSLVIWSVFERLM